MSAWRVVFAVCIAALVACGVGWPSHASAKKKDQVDVSVPKGQTVLLLDVFESKPFRHRERMWGGIARWVEGDDILNDQIHERLAGILVNAGYEVAWEKVPDEYVRPIQKWSFLSMGWSTNMVNQKYLPWFRELMQKHGATSVVIFYTDFGRHTFGVEADSNDPPTNVWFVADIGAVALTGDKLVLRRGDFTSGTCVVRAPFSVIDVPSLDQLNGEKLSPFNDLIASLAAKNAAIDLALTGAYGIRRPSCSTYGTN